MTRGRKWHSSDKQREIGRAMPREAFHFHVPVVWESHFDRIKARLLARSTEVRSVPGGIERDGNATSSGVTFGAESNPVPPRKLGAAGQ